MTEPRLRSLNDLIGIENLLVPAEVNFAIASDRPEFLAMLRGKEVNTDMLVDFAVALMQTNRALRLHVMRLTDKITTLADHVEEMTGHINGLSRLRSRSSIAIRQARAIADFDVDPTSEADNWDQDQADAVRKSADLEP